MSSAVPKKLSKTNVNAYIQYELIRCSLIIILIIIITIIIIIINIHSAVSKIQ